MFMIIPILIAIALRQLMTKARCARAEAFLRLY